MCRLSLNRRTSTSWKPKGLSRPVQSLLFLYCNCYSNLGLRNNMQKRWSCAGGWRKLAGAYVTSVFCWKLVVAGCNPRDCVVFLRAFGAVHASKRISDDWDPLFKTLSDCTDCLRHRKPQSHRHILSALLHFLHSHTRLMPVTLPLYMFCVTAGSIYK